MRGLLKNIFALCSHIKRFINKRVDDFGAQYIAFGIFGVINYPISYFMWHNINTQAYESLTLRLIAGLLCIPLALKNYWPNSLRAYLPIWWYITILYSLPFFGTFMLLKNHVSTDWLMNAVLGLFLLVLIVDWISFAFLMILGMSLAWLCFHLTANEHYHIGSGNLSLALYMYLFAIVIGMIFSHNKQKSQKEKITAIAALGASIAHELRTPLASISANASGVKEYLPELIKTYEIAKDHALPVAHIRPRQFKLLYTALDDIKTEINFANTIINMLLINVEHPDIKASEFEICSMAHCVDEAIRRYPFFPNEKTLIHWENKGDFLFRGKELLTIHVLFNLFKNALYYIKAAGKGEVTLWLETGEKFNRCYFRDTGKGISRATLPYIFARFFTQTHHGSGIGLAFCKMVMQGYGGDIRCRSEEGQYAEFILEFPALKRAKN